LAGEGQFPTISYRRLGLLLVVLGNGEALSVDVSKKKDAVGCS